jgi:acyl-CoA thioester hydrolase
VSQPEGYRLKVSVEVRFSDVDMLGHVNNATFFTYMEQARFVYFDDVMGIDFDANQSVILAEASCAFKQPLFHMDVVDVWVRVSKLGNKSFEHEYALVRQSDGVVAGLGRTVTVGYDYQTQTTIPLLEVWRERIIAYEPALGA